MLLVALPLQGFAAAAMLHCAPSQRAPLVHAEHHEDHHHVQSADTVHHADAGDHHQDHHAKADKCSACHSCCMTTLSFASVAHRIGKPVGTPVLVPHPVKTLFSITLASPQRPPRPTYA